MSEALFFVAPIATGVSLALPKEYSTEFSILLSVLGINSGIINTYLTREGQPDPAWGMASMMFSLLALVTSLGLI